jgi:hypothetical protein
MAQMLGKQLTDEILARQMGRSPLESLVIYRKELGIETHTAEELMTIRNEMMIREFRNHLDLMPVLVRSFNSFIHVRSWRLPPVHRKNWYRKSCGSPDSMVISIIFSLLDQIVRGKPQPDIYQEAIRVLGVEPDATVVLEDSGNGVLAGHRAGSYVIAVPTIHTRNQDFSRADKVVDHLDAAAQWIEMLDQYQITD